MKREKQFVKYWHSAFTVEQLRLFLDSINRVYAGHSIHAAEREALGDLKACIMETGRDLHLHQVPNRVEFHSLVRAVSSAMFDPVWRRCFEEIEVDHSVHDLLASRSN